MESTKAPMLIRSAWVRVLGSDAVMESSAPTPVPRAAMNAPNIATTVITPRAATRPFLRAYRNRIPGSAFPSELAKAM
jgi:hypothetical protein